MTRSLPGFSFSSLIDKLCEQEGAVSKERSQDSTRLQEAVTGGDGDDPAPLPSQ